MQLIDLKLIAASPIECKRLVNLGVVKASALAWLSDGSLVAALDIPEEEQEAAIPAYTLEELAIGLGGSINLPALPQPRPNPNLNEDITWQFYYPEKAKQYSNAATAAAEALAYCIENNYLKLSAVNDRIERKFKPF